MSSAFTFGDSTAKMPLNAIQSAQVLAEIEMAMRSSEIGEGKAFDDGSLFVRYTNFIIRVQPDGNFIGQRVVPEAAELPQRRA